MVLPDTCMSRGKLTAPTRAAQACLATTEPLTGESGDGCCFVGSLKKGKEEQPDKVAAQNTIKSVAAGARITWAIGPKDL